MMLTRRGFLQSVSAGLAVLPVVGALPVLADATPVLQVYKSPFCGCCGAWVEHMRDAGLTVQVTELDDVETVKRDLGVPETLHSCHTALIDGYVIEGHVPAREVLRLLRERLPATGLAVPGMPIGSPGMEQGDQRDPYSVILFNGSEQMSYARY